MNDDPDFPTWLRASGPNLTWNWAHQLYLYERLAAVTEGRCRRLMIFMPPRHCKSETVTVRYTAYRLRFDQKMNIIIGCYNQKLANRFSRRIRRLAEDTGVELSAERKAAEEWETKSGGGVRAVGVGGGVTGFGAQLVIIDDPVKSRAQAESSSYRESTMDWFNDDIYTRLEPNAAIILIQTRWHEDDLAGRLIAEMESGGETWEVVSLPALAEDADDPLGRAVGEALCPDRYDVEALSERKVKLGTYSFAALYQQRPIPHEGGAFKRKWFTEFVDEPPKGLRWCRGYDLAASAKTSADHTASFRCAFDADGILYIADGFRLRIDVPAQRKLIFRTIAAEPNTKHVIEEALHGQGLVQELKQMREFRRTEIIGVRPREDKFTRALSWMHIAEAGRVRIVRGPWNEELLDEICRFTGNNDRSDDQVDAISMAVRGLKPERKIAKGF